MPHVRATSELQGLVGDALDHPPHVIHRNSRPCRVGEEKEISSSEITSTRCRRSAVRSVAVIAREAEIARLPASDLLCRILERFPTQASDQRHRECSGSRFGDAEACVAQQPHDHTVVMQHLDAEYRTGHSFRTKEVVQTLRTTRRREQIGGIPARRSFGFREQVGLLQNGRRHPQRPDRSAHYGGRGSGRIRSSESAFPHCAREEFDVRDRSGRRTARDPSHQLERRRCIRVLTPRRLGPYHDDAEIAVKASKELIRVAASLLPGRLSVLSDDVVPSSQLSRHGTPWARCTWRCWRLAGLAEVARHAQRRRASPRAAALSAPTYLDRLARLSSGPYLELP